jgi:hypothetical protein
MICVGLSPPISANEVIEQILNHAPRSVAGKHYNHAKRLKQMRVALDTWAARVEAIVMSGAAETNVVRFREQGGR